jgi:LmbE family N-acetylglucosaminyl deacetylase
MSGAAGCGDILSQYAGETVLAVGAHPDDLELGVGGTLARLSRSGARVVMAVLSIPNQLRARRAEAKRAAEILGCEVRFLTPNRCSRVEDLKNHQLVGMIDGLVRELKPAAMFSHCLANLHTDHKLAYDACMASQRLGYFDIFCYSPTSCHTVNIPFHPHAYIDISDTIESKMRAIRSHSSQFDGRGLKTEQYRAASNRTGQIVGVAYAEGVEVVRMRLMERPSGAARRKDEKGSEGTRGQGPNRDRRRMG